MPREHKIVFVGSMGAGKTTAIRNVRDTTPVSTEVDNYLVLDKTRANLALARRKTMDTESALTL